MPRERSGFAKQQSLQRFLLWHFQNFFFSFFHLAPVAKKVRNERKILNLRDKKKKGLPSTFDQTEFVMNNKRGISATKTTNTKTQQRCYAKEYTFCYGWT